MSWDTYQRKDNIISVKLSVGGWLDKKLIRLYWLDIDISKSLPEALKNFNTLFVETQKIVRGDTTRKAIIAFLGQRSNDNVDHFVADDISTIHIYIQGTN